MMYQKVLVALDGSPLSENILPYARFFAGTLGIPVELLQVIEPETLIPLIGGRPERYQEVLAAQTGSIGDYLQRTARSFPASSPVQRSVEVGKPQDIIINRAAADPGTLIAMTTHGRSGVQRWLLGSIAEKVVQATRNHLLLVRAPSERGIPEGALLKSVVVPLDGSELAESVIPHVVDLAKKMEIAVILVRAFHLPVQDPFGESQYDERIWEMVQEDAKNYLEKKVAQLKNTGVQRVTSVSLEGVAAGSIIDFARKTPNNMIAMCTHGRSGVGRWVLGSVTDRVVRHSGDPVLVIPARSTGSTS